MNACKLIISCKNALKIKYGADFPKLEKLLKKLAVADKKLHLDTKIVFIDDAVSARRAGIRTVKSCTRQQCKKAVDDLYKKWLPAYIVLFGAQDIFPFQELNNPAGDEDEQVPTDLPYACESGYSKEIASFTGPTRVVGRIPDIPGKADLAYVTTLLTNITRNKPGQPNPYLNYFALTADVWKKSTQLTVQEIFGNTSSLQYCPPAGKSYTKKQLNALTHFFNCHGARFDYSYYGQKGNNYPSAIHTKQLTGKLTYGTVVAAECCYGAELVDGHQSGNKEDISISNNYLLNGALAFMGSSTIAYGPSDSQGLADLITQYFIKSVLEGASSGRAMLEARQKFLSVSGPSLDPYELKTLAQFYLLGDPSIQVIRHVGDQKAGSIKKGGISNNRFNLFNKGMSLKKTIAPCKKIISGSKTKYRTVIKKLLKEQNFTAKAKEQVYRIKPELYQAKLVSPTSKELVSTEAKYRTFMETKKLPGSRLQHIKVLVVKETPGEVLGWRTYVSR